MRFSRSQLGQFRGEGQGILEFAGRVSLQIPAERASDRNSESELAPSRPPTPPTRSKHLRPLPKPTSQITNSRLAAAILSGNRNCSTYNSLRFLGRADYRMKCLAFRLAADAVDAIGQAHELVFGHTIFVGIDVRRFCSPRTRSKRLESPHVDSYNVLFWRERAMSVILGVGQK
jgi:hypothetical protein